MDQRQLAPPDLRRFDLHHVQPALRHPLRHRAHPCRALGMKRGRVVLQRRRVRRDYDLHPRTLSQVPNRLHVDGVWPGPLSVRRGWSRAVARPWNDEAPDAAMRLIRGSHEFLGEASRRLGSLDIRDHLFTSSLPDRDPNLEASRV